MSSRVPLACAALTRSCHAFNRKLTDLLLLGYVVYQCASRSGWREAAATRELTTAGAAVSHRFFDVSHDSIHGVGWRFPLVAVLNAIFLHVFVTGHYM